MRMYSKNNQHQGTGILLRKIVIVLVAATTYIISGMVAKSGAAFSQVSHKWVYPQVALTIFVFCLLYLFLFPKKIMGRINAQFFVEKKNEDWQTLTGLPVINYRKDGSLGEIIYFVGGTKDCSYLRFNPLGGEARRIKIMYRPVNEFAFGLKIQMSQYGKLNQDGWLVFNPDLPTRAGAQKWQPRKINLRSSAHHWLVQEVDVKQLTKTTFGTSGWKFENLLGIQVCGTGAIQDITISN